MQYSIKLGLLSLATSMFLVGCGNSEDTALADATQTGYFIDAAVSGLEYSSSSGLSGTTDSSGKFHYREGDSVSFHIGNLALGTYAPDVSQNGLVAPQLLAQGDTDLELFILQTLQSLDSDNNSSKGITIAKEIVESFKQELQTKTEIAKITKEDIFSTKNG